MSTDPFDNIGFNLEIGQATFVELISVRQKRTIAIPTRTVIREDPNFKLPGVIDTVSPQRISPPRQGTTYKIGRAAIVEKTIRLKTERTQLAKEQRLQRRSAHALAITPQDAPQPPSTLLTGIHAYWALNNLPAAGKNEILYFGFNTPATEKRTTVTVSEDQSTYGTQSAITPVNEKQSRGWKPWKTGLPASAFTGDIIGSFRLTFKGQQTSQINIPTTGTLAAKNAALVASMQSALEALPNIGTGNILVETGLFTSLSADYGAGESSSNPLHNFYFTFRNALGGQNITDPNSSLDGRIGFVTDPSKGVNGTIIANLTSTPGTGIYQDNEPYIMNNPDGLPQLYNNVGVVHGRTGQNKRVIVYFTDIPPESGTFTLTIIFSRSAKETGPIPYNATNSQLLAILEAVPGLAGNVGVLSPNYEHSGWIIEFKGALQYSNAPIVVPQKNDLYSSSSIYITGGTFDITVPHPTRESEYINVANIPIGISAGTLGTLIENSDIYRTAKWGGAVAYHESTRDSTIAAYGSNYNNPGLTVQKATKNFDTLGFTASFAGKFYGIAYYNAGGDKDLPQAFISTRNIITRNNYGNGPPANDVTGSIGVIQDGAEPVNPSVGEIQVISGNTGLVGDFRLSYSGESTPLMKISPTGITAAVDVQTNLRTIFHSNDLTVTRYVVAAAGNTSDVYYLVEFIGALLGEDLDTISSSNTNITIRTKGNGGILIDGTDLVTGKTPVANMADAPLTAPNFPIATVTSKTLLSEGMRASGTLSLTEIPDFDEEEANYLETRSAKVLTGWPPDRGHPQSTFSMWFKYFGSATSTSVMYLAEAILENAVSPTLRLIASASDNAITLRLEARKNSTAVHSAEVTNLEIGVWHHVIFWIDSNVEIGMKVNNTTVVTTPQSDSDFATVRWGAFRLGRPVSGISPLSVSAQAVSSGTDQWGIDEVGYWSRLLSSAEDDELWNSGAGNPYPFGATNDDGGGGGIDDNTFETGWRTPTGCARSNMKAGFKWDRVPTAAGQYPNINFYNIFIEYLMRNPDNPAETRVIRRWPTGSSQSSGDNRATWRGNVSDALYEILRRKYPADELLLQTVLYDSFITPLNNDDYVYADYSDVTGNNVNDTMTLNFPSPPGGVVESIAFGGLANMASLSSGNSIDVTISYTRQNSQFSFTKSGDDNNFYNAGSESKARWNYITDEKFVIDTPSSTGLDQCTAAVQETYTGSGTLTFKKFVVFGGGQASESCVATADVVVIQEGQGANEIQSVVIPTATSGSFTLSFKDQVTSNIAYGAGPNTVKSRLESLSTIGTGNVSVTGTGTAANPYLVEFINALANFNQPLMVGNGDNLIGASSLTITIETQGSRNERQKISKTGVSNGGENAIHRIFYHVSGIDNEDLPLSLLNQVTGTFTVSYAGIKTVPINAQANISEVLAALTALPAFSEIPAPIQVTERSNVYLYQNEQGHKIVTRQWLAEFINSLGSQPINPFITMADNNLVGPINPLRSKSAINVIGYCSYPSFGQPSDTTRKPGVITGTWEVTTTAGGNTITTAIPYSDNQTVAQVQQYFDISLGSGNVVVSVADSPYNLQDIQCRVYKLTYVDSGAYGYMPVTNNVSVTGLSFTPAYAIYGTPSFNRYAFAIQGGQTVRYWVGMTGNNIYKVGRAGIVDPFTLTFGGQTTALLPQNASLKQVREGLEAISSIGSGNVRVIASTGAQPADDAPYRGPWSVDFIGSFAGQNVAEMIVSPTTQYRMTTLSQGGVGTSEVQVIRVNATAGTFKLIFEGFSTGDISYNASAATVQTALEGLASIGAGNVLVTGDNGGPYYVEFSGEFGVTDLDLIQGDSTNLRGGDITITTTQEGQSSVEEIQRITLFKAVGGNFRLIINGQKTARIRYNALQEHVYNALAAHPDVGPDVAVIGPQKGPWDVIFPSYLGNMETMGVDVSELLCNPLILGYVGPGPYPYDIVDDPEPGLDPDPPPVVLTDAQNVARPFIFQRDLFDPNMTIGGELVTIRRLALLKKLKVDDYVPYIRRANKLVATDFATQIYTGLSVVLIHKDIDSDGGKRRVLSHLASHREILPSRVRWPE